MYSNFYQSKTAWLLRTLLVVSVAYFVPAVVAVETAYSTPLGIYVVKVAGKPAAATSARTYMGIQLLPSIRYRGPAGQVTGTNTTLLGGSGLTTLADPERKSYLHVLTGNGKGFITDIEEFRTNDLRCAADLTGWVGLGTQVMIRPHPHLSDIFGADNRFGLGSGPDAEHADNVVIWDSNLQQQRVYFFQSTRARWEEKDVIADANRATIRFPYGLYIVRRSAGTVRVALSGEIGSESVLLPVRDGANVFSLPINLSASVESLIRSSGPFSVMTGPNARRSDLLTFQEPSTGIQRGPFYYQSNPSGSGWREIGVNGSDQTALPLDTLSTLILRRNGAAGFVLAEGSMDPPPLGSVAPIPADPEQGELPITVEMPRIRGMSPEVIYTLQTSQDLQSWSILNYPFRPDHRVIFTLPPGQSRAFYRLSVSL